MGCLARLSSYLVLSALGWIGLLCFVPGVAVGAPQAYEVTTPDGKLRRQLSATVERGIPYFALAHVAEILGGEVQLAQGGQTATLRVGKMALRLGLGRTTVLTGGRALVLERPPKRIGGVFMVPGEFISKGGTRALGRPVTLSPLPGPQSTLADLRFRSYPGYTRVVVEGSAGFEYSLTETKDRLQVELRNLRSAPVTRQIEDGLVRRLELGPRQDGGTLLQITFAGRPVWPKILALSDPPRLVLDFPRALPARPKGDAREGRPLRVVVLDPGHGGHDPGAVGPGKLQEKDVVLDVAKRLARLLDEEGIRTIMTRTGDYFVRLKERTSFANGQRADLFISIHANAHRISSSEGVETYFLSSEATDNEARAVAAFENGVIALEPHTPKEDILKSILWDLAQSQFQEESSYLAETIQDSLAQGLRLQNRGVKQAAFYVLGGAAMPAVLVEVGFVTNPQEAERLTDNAYRERVARALAAGVLNYKRRYDQRMGALR